MKQTLGKLIKEKKNILLKMKWIIWKKIVIQDFTYCFLHKKISSKKKSSITKSTRSLYFQNYGEGLIYLMTNRLKQYALDHSILGAKPGRETLIELLSLGWLIQTMEEKALIKTVII